MPPPPTSSPSRGLVLVMAFSTGIGAANIFYNQPMLGIIGRAFHGQGATHLIPPITMLGYAAGLLFLVPLGDLFERRKLILIQFLALAAALACAAQAPNVWFLLAASLLIGAGATVAQQIVPLAASLASVERRGAVVGSVMSGLLCGVLLSRTLAGLVAAHWGWRAMFWVGVPLALLGALITRILPHTPSSASMGYGALLGSLVDLWREEPRLRRAACTQALLFAAFNAFWTILALHLERPPLSRGADVAGLFGIVGTIGVLVAPLAGRQADRRGPRQVVMLGAFCALAAWLVMLGWGALPGLFAGIIILDFGVQSSLIAHQQLIYGLRPDARNRLNTIFMVGMFLGATLGASGAMLAWRSTGWPGVCAFAIVLCLLASLIPILSRSSLRGRAPRTS